MAGCAALRGPVVARDTRPAPREWLFFDAAAAFRAPGAVISFTPPLFALFALPFSVLGFHGLLLPNLLAWLGTTALILSEARRLGCTRLAVWVGGLAFALAGFSLEYAAGVWPHALSTFLCFAAFVSGLRAMESERARAAVLAGLCAGLAAGVRYQNAVLAALLAAALWLFSERRWRKALQPA